jgi:hypothetical protein
MARSRLGLKALILCGLVAGMMSLTARAAHATLNSHWWLVDPATGILKELNATAIITQDSPVGTLLTKIAGIKVEFNCTATESTGVLVEKGGGVSKSNGGAKVKFSNCTKKLNGATSAPCEPNNEGKEKGVIVTKLLHGLIVLHELAGGAKDHLIQILPVAAGPFATVEMGGECAIGTKVPVIGKLFVKECSPNTLLTHLEKHLLEQGPLTALFAISETAEHASTLDGSEWLLLTGEHKDWKFSGTTL